MDVIFMLRGFMDKLTLSEFHCLLVGSHATIAGFMFGLFVVFGVSKRKCSQDFKPCGHMYAILFALQAPPQHLLCAAIISAPAVIAVTKVNFPEKEKSKTREIDDILITGK